MRLVGRGTELSSVAAALDDATEGSGRVVGLAGEAGIGKTRLAREVMALAEERGFVMMWGRASTCEMAVAYAPILEAVGGHLRSLEAPERAFTTEGLPELGALFGSLVTGRAQPLLDPALEQARLFEAVARLFERIQRASPVLLVIDDVHEADAASIALLEYLCRRLDRQRMLTLLTYRHDAHSQRHLRDLNTGLRRSGLLQEVILERLARDALAELATAWLGGPVSGRLLDTLENRAGAVPLFVETILAGLREAGYLRRTGHGWTVLPGVALDVPVRARDVILQPLDRLEPKDRRLVDILSVAGVPVEHRRLALVAETPDDEDLIVRVTRLRSVGLVDEVVTAAGVNYRLHHSLIAEVAHAELSEALRRRIHASFVAALERDDPVDLPRLARHYLGAGSDADPERAREILTAAGRQALAVYANREAATLLGAAADMHRAAGSNQVGGLLSQLGEALERIGQHDAAMRTWEEALEASTATGDVLSTGRIHRRLAAAAWERGQLGEVDAHLARGYEVLSRIGPSHELAELRLTEVWLRGWNHDFGAAVRAVAALTDLASILSSPRVTIEALLAESRLRLVQTRPEEAISAARRALDLSESEGDPLLLWRAHDLNVICAIWGGDHATVRRHASSALAFAQELAVPGLELRSTAMLAVVEFFAGEWASAFDRTAEVLERAPLVGHPRAAVHSVAIAAILHSYRGDVSIAERVLAEVESSHGRLEHDLGVVVMLVPAEIQIALSRGDIPRAAELTDRALPRVPGFGGWLLLSAGDVYLRTERWEDALALAPRIPEMAVGERSAVAGEALRIRGVAHAGLGDQEGALRCLADAHAVFSELEMPFFAARARLDWGRVSAGQEGAAAVRESLEVFERIGAQPFIDDARTLLLDLGVTPPRRQRSGPLSEREREVACLAAQGLSSTQIAEHLVISPHTVRTHLKRIHERLGVSSRAELTRYVVEAGWLGGTSSVSTPSVDRPPVGDPSADTPPVGTPS